MSKNEKFSFMMDGKAVSHECGGDNSKDGNPYFYMLVFFRGDVMNKYNENPDKYRFQKNDPFPDGTFDGQVFTPGDCPDDWSLCFMSHPNGYITAYLGDLGELSHDEQLHWKSHNVLKAT